MALHGSRFEIFTEKSLATQVYLAVIRQMCDRVIVMKDGEALESGSNESIFEKPKHAYTRSLLDAMPKFQGLAKI